jgi:hypothetical protein
MKWSKKGTIFSPKRNYEWNQSHAQIPLIEILEDSIFRIYYSSRDKQNRSRTSFIEVEAVNPSNILYIHNKPILELGPLGTFDESGIMPSSIINFNNKKFLYYTGWNTGSNVSYRLSIGLAISEDNGKTFKKLSQGPILDRSIFDECLCASPFVIIEKDIWKMWYISGTKWEIIDGKPEPFYHIKYADSLDGISWNREGRICIDYDSFTEGISRPCIFKEQDQYLIYYSYRNNKNYRSNKASSYRIGVATSLNGKEWTRKDESIGITLSLNGWDSEMLCYPYVFEWHNKRYMFYNGNGFGKTGFGYAVLEE